MGVHLERRRPSASPPASSELFPLSWLVVLLKPVKLASCLFIYASARLSALSESPPCLSISISISISSSSSSSSSFHLVFAGSKH